MSFIRLIEKIAWNFTGFILLSIFINSIYVKNATSDPGCLRAGDISLCTVDYTGYNSCSGSFNACSYLTWDSYCDTKTGKLYFSWEEALADVCGSSGQRDNSADRSEKQKIDQDAFDGVSAVIKKWNEIEKEKRYGPRGPDTTGQLLERLNN